MTPDVMTPVTKANIRSSESEGHLKVQRGPTLWCYGKGSQIQKLKTNTSCKVDLDCAFVHYRR